MKNNIEQCIVPSSCNRQSTKSPLIIIYSAVFILLPLIFGGLIYVIFRSKRLLMFKWFASMKLMPLILALRILIKHHITFPNWFIFSLPDALWVYSLSLFIGIIWYNGQIVRSLLILIFSLACGVGFEISQFFHLIPGAFDITDLSLDLFATFSAILSTHFLRRETVCLNAFRK